MPRTLTYHDRVHDVLGWLVYDADYPLSAGGCRVQAGLTPADLAVLASRMTLKQRVLQTNVSGAKCGLAMDPQAPYRTEVLRGFLAFLADELRHRFSMGCDMGTSFTELDRLAAEAGVPSIKYAVKAVQGLDDDDFFSRMGLLDARVGLLTLGERRAGHALAHAALTAGLYLGRPAPLTVAVQGFGNLGRGAAYSIAEAGARVVALADEFGCVAHPAGIDVMNLPATTRSVGDLAAGAPLLPREAIADQPVDVLILAAGADGLSGEQAATAPAGAVAVGANCGLSPVAEQILAGRGVLVVPDFIGGIGGSASMEALFGPARAPTAAEVLDDVRVLMVELVSDLIVTADRSGTSLSAAAAELAKAAPLSPGARPYGGCSYLASRRRLDPAPTAPSLH